MSDFSANNNYMPSGDESSEEFEDYCNSQEFSNDEVSIDVL